MTSNGHEPRHISEKKSHLQLQDFLYSDFTVTSQSWFMTHEWECGSVQSSMAKIEQVFWLSAGLITTRLISTARCESSVDFSQGLSDWHTCVKITVAGRKVFCTVGSCLLLHKCVCPVCDLCLHVKGLLDSDLCWSLNWTRCPFCVWLLMRKTIYLW